MRYVWNLTVKNIVIIFCLFLLSAITYPVICVQAQPVQTNPVTSTTSVQHAQSVQPTQISPPEIPPTPRSKLEIIQYILLPFAIGASIWLILRLEKIEREEAKGNKEE